MAMPEMPMMTEEPMMDAMPEMGMSSSEVCIPLTSLSMEDEDSKPVAPEIGDPVEFTATGTVSRVENGNAYITLETANGEPIAAPAMESPMAELGEADLRGMAGQLDTESAQNYL